ncbi:copper resistance CopC family protein [Herbidospora daliensis]|uniref:copper resistance CopC family protein n=1 Tax=Herbidospora daliensis TaxID=295585 RepID=UPI000783ED83|nr:copper resistance CopC family protein [Herbidospora daliensis]
MRRLAVIAAVVAALFATAPPAFAHDQLKGSSPKENATVDDLKSITLTFSSQVRFPAVVLRDGADNLLPLSKPVVDGKQVSADLVSPPPPGRYVIGWRVVSSDGHPIEGEIPFTLAGAAPAETAAPAEAPGSASPADSKTSPANTPAAGTSALAATSDSTMSRPAPGTQRVSAPEEDDGGGFGFVWLAGGLVVALGLGFLLFRGRGRGSPS